ncbi:MAG: hypothetical protein ACI38Y_07685 [Candidatus Methanomethylophilaceae archaeon]
MGEDMNDRTADALFLLIIAISILIPVIMIARFFLSGIMCIIVSVLITSAIITAVYLPSRRVSSYGE